VIFYLEELILDDKASDDEVELYNFGLRYEYFDLDSKIYRKVVRKMDKLYRGDDF